MASLWQRLVGLFSTAEIIILIDDHEPTCVRGKVHARLLRDVAEVLRANGVATGQISMSWNNRGPQLKLSSSIDAGVQQRVRNVWFSHPNTPRQ